MTAANTRAGGMSFVACDPMIPIPGTNIAPNDAGIPNISNYYCCGGNEQNMATLRVATIDSGGLLGVASGTYCGAMTPMQGSAKYFIQGNPATRMGDMSMTNSGNMVCVQASPSQLKYFINA
ncbi:DUF4150 domain-containing protein [Rahnella sp. SAP-1]|uniref:DUF4150 domain-containing protein n=1 Tax=Rouxiella aceris TaxID=2703884 RepID=A0A848MF88_9GAMM|nr:PAAR-like domain-containing protein [Rouxiella aceris]NMP25702.1 DUF4150 domain-containing protein [Rouxiella aceris]